MTHEPGMTTPGGNTSPRKRSFIPFFKDLLKKERSLSVSTLSSTERSTRESSLGKCCQLDAGFGTLEPLEDNDLAKEFADLYAGIGTHVTHFYPAKGVKDVPKAVVQTATSGMSVSPAVISSFLKDEQTRSAALELCISWTVLSRSLLLQLGVKDCPRSTFLPPEIVECFQSFSVMLHEECKPAHFALLSRWKQMTATLMYSYYVHDSFGIFDARTINIDRAIEDLDPLLRVYADPEEQFMRVADLKEVLQTGAKFAFTLFAQPSYWSFDWLNDGTPGQPDGVDPGYVFGDGEAPEVDHKERPENVVVWPALIRVIDGDGRPCRDYLTEKKLLIEV